EQLVRNTENAHTLRRTQALLWLDDGETAEDVADLLYVGRAVVYKWIKQFQERSELDLRARVSDGLRSGRPGTVLAVIDPLIEAVVDRDPQKLGYRATVWTAPLVVHYLKEVHDLEVSCQSVRLAIARLRVRWKRPRHQLALRPATWRQA